MELFKLHVENVGRIKQAELSIRPLTVFVGPDNTNKTWTAYALWLLVKWFSGNYASGLLPANLRHLNWFDVDGQLRQIVDHAVAGLCETFQGTQDGGTVRDGLARASLLSQIDYPLRVALTRSGIAKVLGGVSTLAADARVTLKMSESQCQFSAGVFRSASFEYTKAQRDSCTATLVDAHGNPGSPDKQMLDPSNDPELRHFLDGNIHQLLCACFGDAYVFPVERKTLTSLYGSSHAREIRGFSLPGTVYATMLVATILNSGGLARLSPLSNVGDLMERRILQGTVGVQLEGPAVVIVFTDDLGNAMPVHAASSLVRALAGLDVYLRYAAVPGDLIVVDEPEMNAHPEAQLMIAELLGVLVNKGINVVITTHSPYIVDHINNLVEAAHLCEEKQKKIAGRFKLKTKEAFVHEDKVATYEFHEEAEEVKVSNIFDRGQRLIDWDTFGKVSDEVGKLFNDILVAAHEE